MVEKKYDYGILMGGMISLNSTPENIHFLKNNDRLLNTIELYKKGIIDKMIKIRISSKSFLQNQVRSMVGCLKYLSTYKWSLNDFKKAFQSKKRSKCAPPAPANGLYLQDVKY